jgi:putative oxidoreductase
LLRLFSTFAHGLPGVGLLLMRLVAGLELIVHGITSLQAGPPAGSAMLAVLAASAGIGLIAGLGTPIAGTLVALIELWNVFLDPHDPWTHILLGTIGTALALLGPGAWSVDARLFGWKRIDLP